MQYTASNSKLSLYGLIDSIDLDLITGKNVNLNSEGYARICKEKLHRLVIVRALGRPIKAGFMVDHINRNKLDNRRENLREVSCLENNINKDRKGRKSFGSTYLKSRGKWQAQIKINGKQTYLGVFNTEEQAQECYLKKAKELQRL